MKVTGNCDNCSRYDKRRVEAGDFTLEEIAQAAYSPFTSSDKHTLHMLISYLMKERDSKPYEAEIVIDHD